MTARVEYREATCKSALNKVEDMTFRWSLNPYRGCVHGCHYCFARRYHAYYDLNPNDGFTGIVFVKKNVATVLREELWLPRWQRETIAIGTATDPYQPIEGKYRLTRGCLEAIADRRNPMSLITKGPMVVRDVDVLASIAASASCTVCVSITTLDADLARRLEPTTAPPASRLRAVNMLAKAGVRVGVLLAPVVPGITDDGPSMTAVAREAAANGASFLHGRTLQLRDGTRDHFMAYLEQDFPVLRQPYGVLYRQPDPPRDVRRGIELRVADLRARYGLSEREVRDEQRRPQQMEMVLGA